MPGSVDSIFYREEYSIPEGALAILLSEDRSIKEVLEKAGAGFGSGASVELDRGNGRLRVKNTREELQIVAAIVDSWNWIRKAKELAEVERMEEKLRNIVIPEIDFSETPLSEAFDFIERESIRNDFSDDADKGIRISVNQIGLANEASEREEDPFGFGASTASAPALEVTLRLTMVPLGEAIRYTGALAQMTYRVHADHVSVGPHVNPDLPFETRIFRVPPNFLSLMESVDRIDKPSDPFAFPEPPGSTKSEKSSPKRWMEEAGIVFFPGASVSYDQSRSLLSVRHSSDQMELVEALVRSIAQTATDRDVREARFDAIEAKLQSISIPAYSCRNRHIRWVLHDLEKIGRAYDTESLVWDRGVSLRIEPPGGKHRRIPGDPFATPFDLVPTLNLRFDGGTFIEVLAEVAEQTGGTLEIDESGVVLIVGAP